MQICAICGKGPAGGTKSNIFRGGNNGVQLFLLVCDECVQRTAAGLVDEIPDYTLIQIPGGISIVEVILLIAHWANEKACLDEGLEQCVGIAEIMDLEYAAHRVEALGKVIVPIIDILCTMNPMHVCALADLRSIECKFRAYFADEFAQKGLSRELRRVWDQMRDTLAKYPEK